MGGGDRVGADGVVGEVGVAGEWWVRGGYEDGVCVCVCGGWWVGGKGLQ